jgi:zinc transport system substrate-binding protein
MLKKLWMVLTVFFALTAYAQAQEKIHIAVTIAPLAEFVEQIGGDLVSVTVMVPPGGSPHTYEPKPGQLKALGRSKLYVKVGSGIEFELTWLDKILAVNRDLMVCDSSRGIRLIRMVNDHHDEKGAGHRHHPGNDPHIWTSLGNAVVMAGNIRDGLIQVDPANETQYRKNADAYILKLRALRDRIAEQLKNTRNRKFMVLHAAFGYFADEFHLTQIPMEVGGKEPSARNIARLIKKAKAENISVIFAEPQFNTKSAQVIASAIQGEMVLIDPLSGHYLQNMEKMAFALIGKLK